MKKLLNFLLFLPCVLGSMRGLNIFGLETEHGSLMCDWAHTYEWLLRKVSSLGFNTVRLPFSHDYLHTTDLKGMDDFFEAVLHTDLSVVLDFHRIYNTHQSPKPYDDTHPFSQFVDDWLFVLDRYHNNSHLVGVDVFNEYQPKDFEEWNRLAREVVETVESHFPYRFFYMVGCCNWGGDCRFVDLSDLPYQNRIYYTIHKYCWSDTNNLQESWDGSFGQFVGDGRKMVVGEFGFKSDLPNQVDWFKHFTAYLKSRNITNSFFWCLSPNSGDTGGILLDDCDTVDWDKMNLLWNYWGYKPRHLRN